MSDWASKQWRNALIWRLAILRGILYSVGILATCWLTAMNKLDWSLLTSDEKFSILVGIFGSWATVMVAFLDKVVHSISAGNVPFDESPPAKPQP